ncbi:YidH family protein [Acidithiobacillus sp. IBUN Pt1247-S3]|uniref:YidH family protein n=1 Tax=Acidithiobacillus sp. IBUN Pt1247-S3 TaxID=3166642 RepID=UPI0034E47A18
MLLSKKLLALREPRLYLSMERSYLALLKFIIVAFGAGLLARKVAMALVFFHDQRLRPFFLDLYHLLTIPAVVTIFLLIPIFWRDLRSLSQGPSVSAKEMNDPRVYFSAERTFLSWTRTALSSLALAFVLAKFDFFLRKFSLVLHQPIPLLHRLSGTNTLFIGFAVVLMVFGFWGLAATLNDIQRGECATHVWRYILFLLMLFLVGMGMLHLLLLLGR